MDTTERANKVIQQLAIAVNAMKEARKAIGNITPEDDYIWLELSYMLINTYRNISGFLKGRLEGQQTTMFEKE